MNRYVKLVNFSFMVNKAKPDGSYVVFSNRVMEDVVEGEGYTVKEISRALIRYDLETNKKESIAFPEIVHQDAEPFAFNGSTIYFAGITDQYLEVTPYDIKSKKTGKNWRSSYKVSMMAGKCRCIKSRTASYMSLPNQKKWMCQLKYMCWI